MARHLSAKGSLEMSVKARHLGVWNDSLSPTSNTAQPYHLYDAWTLSSALSYRGEACQHLDLDLVDLEVKGHFRIRKVQPEVWYSRK
jgi:hypothetical protein